MSRNARYIGIDDYAAAATAVRHLIGLGHIDIALLHGDDEIDLNFDVPRVRIRPSTTSCARRGCPSGPNRTCGGTSPSQRPGGVPPSLAADGLEPLQSFAPRMSGHGVIFEADKAGVRVPEDLSVIGIDDHDFAEAMGLTTVGQRPDQQAELGTKMLLDELDGIAGPCSPPWRRTG